MNSTHTFTYSESHQPPPSEPTEARLVLLRGGPMPYSGQRSHTHGGEDPRVAIMEASRELVEDPFPLLSLPVEHERLQEVPE